MPLDRLPWHFVHFVGLTYLLVFSDLSWPSWGWWWWEEDDKKGHRVMVTGEGGAIQTTACHGRDSIPCYFPMTCKLQCPCATAASSAGFTALSSPPNYGPPPHYKPRRCGFLRCR
ncbi:hypothetical protein QBC47DRAFT_370186 [Echria macrotheca]|uniref:Uncharacterized protein n=1 Tax=Echria macrotheca TaxID=438768 RepID=A0AAJ0BQB9_9PEZI|nr:hypothetical protein QBC47DRAFT_370186 [Echria macrotheca]